MGNNHPGETRASAERLGGVFQSRSLGMTLFGYVVRHTLRPSLLAFAGLTLKDCKVKQFPSHGTAGKALTQGFIDLYSFGTTGSRPMAPSKPLYRRFGSGSLGS